MPLRLETLRPQDLAAVRHLTFPAVAAIAQQRYPDTVRIIAAGLDDDTAGLAVAIPGPDGEFELMSLYIAPFFRRLGLGTALLDAVEADFRDRGFRLGVHFLNVPEHGQDHARFMVTRGWSRPAVTKLICESTVPLALKTPWLVEARMPDQYRVKAWGTLTSRQRADLASAMRGWTTDETDPFVHEDGHDIETSLVLEEIDSGAILGWVIAHRLNDTTLRWTCSYLRPDLQRRGLMPALWLAVVHRQARQPGLVDFIFTVPVGQLRMARFALRRMRPWLSHLAYACATMKKVA